MSWETVAANAGAIAVGTSSLAGAYTQYSAGLTQSIYAEHNAVMSEFDAMFVDIQTEAEGKLLRVQEKLTLDSLRKDELRALASARVKAGASGFALDAGSNQDVTTDIGNEVALDAALIRLSTNLDIDLLSLGGSLQKGQLRGEADRSRVEGAIAKGTGTINAINTVVSGASQISTLLAPKKKD